MRSCEDASERASNHVKEMEDRGRVSGSSDFGMLLRRYRIAAGLSQEALAERARMSIQGISALERGYRRSPQRETLVLLVSALALRDEQRREFETAATRVGVVRRGSSIAVGPWSGPAIPTLPVALTSFVGRDIELEEIAALVRGHRMVTLTGAGGVGKTQTALHVAITRGAGTDGAVCFAGLASIESPSLIVVAIASALGLQEVPNHPLLETLVAHLKNKALLLILDNCEHVITEAAIVAEALLSGCPRARILATSREPLRAAGEYCYRLPPLSVPSPEAAHRLTATDAALYAAIVLFSHRARAVDHRFTLSDENAPVVAGLCVRLDGIPLAIELAAARVNQLSMKTIAEKLDDRFRILAGGERTALPRQQTMRATIDWSYHLLSAAEQRVFERLSVFAGGCTLDSAASVCADEEVATEDVLEILSSLVDKSLLVVDIKGNESRYRLLESFRQYAREKLAMGSDHDTVAHRHALACLELAERFNYARDFEPDDVWRPLVHEELDNWRAALQWLLTERGEVMLGQRLVGQLFGVWVVIPTEGRRWITSAFELVNRGTPTSVLAGLSYAEATVAWHLREHKVQLASSETAIVRYRVIQDLLGMARAQSLAGFALMCLGRIAEAKSLLEETLQLARKLGNRRLAAYVLRCLGLGSALRHEFVTARSCVVEALHYYEALGAELDAAQAMYELGIIEFGAKDAELALRYATGALAAYRSFNHVRLVAETLTTMAMYLVALARYDEAGERARQALELTREQQLDALTAWTLQHLAAIAALQPPFGLERATDPRARAARVLGYVDVRLLAIGSQRLPFMEPEYDHALVVLRETLGIDAVATLMAAGATMTEEQAVEEALVL
jgi:predicted ATPase/DNA-binding XRE family transcriptional regulator